MSRCCDIRYEPFCVTWTGESAANWRVELSGAVTAQLELTGRLGSNGLEIGHGSKGKITSRRVVKVSERMLPWLGLAMVFEQREPH